MAVKSYKKPIPPTCNLEVHYRVHRSTKTSHHEPDKAAHVLIPCFRLNISHAHNELHSCSLLSPWSRRFVEQLLVKFDVHGKRRVSISFQKIPFLVPILSPVYPLTPPTLVIWYHEVPSLTSIHFNLQFTKVFIYLFMVYSRMLSVSENKHLRMLG